MRIFQPLRDPVVARLWVGQVLSNVGDEIYNVALVWLAAELVGPDAGYVSAMQAAAIFFCGLVSYRIADGWDHRRTMVAVDVLRGLTVLTVPLLLGSQGTGRWFLFAVAAVVSGLSAFFLPALKASLPDLARDEAALQAVNGLMEVTFRFARVVGPGLVGLLTRLVPVAHFFTVDALSFFCSALSIQGLRHAMPAAHPHERPPRVTMREMWGRLEAHPRLRFLMLSAPPAAAAWWMVYPLGMALLVRGTDDMGALAWLVSAYGVGNLGCNLVVGSLHLRDPMRLVCLGRVCAGLGFVALALAPSFGWMLASSALAACGGPMTDLGFLAMLTKVGDRWDVARIYRLGMSLEYASMVVAFMASPWLFRTLGVAALVGTCGAIVTAMGLLGLLARRRLGSVIQPPSDSV